MLRRCYTPTAKAYADYGGRGISVCDRWRGPGGFSHFVEDMGPRPDGHSIDRRDNDSSYSPDNCRWATRREQQLNRRVTLRVLIEGIEYVAANLAREHGIKTDTVVHRAGLGLSFAEVISQERRIFTEGLALGGNANGRRQQAKPCCPQGHSYSEHGAITPQGWRYCKKCRAARQLDRYYRAKGNA